jgi:TetR/AcrR family transcriptional repressor of nem operon
MRYTDTHKEETHKKLLAIAAGALRQKGPEGLVVADLMKSAGLTHGGFYAHFKSKDALLTETLGEIFARVGRRWDRVMDGLPPLEALDAYIDFYLSPQHRDHPESGCPVVALNSDLPRQSRAFRKAFDAGVAAMRARIAQRAEEAGLSTPDDLAQAILSSMVGAVVLARSVCDAAMSDDILSSTRRDIHARLHAPAPSR